MRTRSLLKAFTFINIAMIILPIVNSANIARNDLEQYVFASELMDVIANYFNISPDEVSAFLDVVPFNSTRKFTTILIRDAAIKLMNVADKMHSLDEKTFRFAIAAYDDV